MNKFNTPKKTVIYDCEIKKAILGKGETPIPDIAYCDGWRDFANMGISCIGVYDYGKDRYSIHDEANMHEFVDLVGEAELLVGFNSNSFDDLLLDANNINVYHRPRYDILSAIWVSEGLWASYKAGGSHDGYGLSDLCLANFGEEKTGDGGALAPVDYQMGRHAKLHNYCLRDVWLTKLLFDRIAATGFLVNPKENGGHITINCWPRLIN